MSSKCKTGKGKKGSSKHSSIRYNRTFSSAAVTIKTESFDLKHDHTIKPIPCDLKYDYPFKSTSIYADLK